ncbi:MAG: glutamyl-tRNA reductase [Candidatus Azotimanducaceae bacterium]|jgi:glutamyl-tRNA reductase
MSIVAYGLNHRTASVELRERIAFPEENLSDMLSRLTHDLSNIREAAIVSTCNRTELYCSLSDDNTHDISQWLSAIRPVDITELEDSSYKHWDKDAAKHMIRVAAGLDSQMLGEPQIMGQVKMAYEVARKTGTIGPDLDLLSRMTLRTAKDIRTQTEIGRNPISVAYAAVSLATQIFTNLNTKRALLLGAGDTISLVAEHLAAKNIAGLAIANRTLANAQVLAAKFDAVAMQLSDVAGRLADYDVVISSTASSLPILGKGAVEAAIKKRKRKPMFMVDIAVPRDIESEVGSLPDVYLYTIDDLSNIVQANIEQRQKAAQGAEVIVDMGTERYERERRIHSDKALLTRLRDEAEATRVQELNKALNSLEQTGDAEAALTQLSRALTNKLIHPPTAAIRTASADGKTELVDQLRQVYQLDDAPANEPKPNLSESSKKTD